MHFQVLTLTLETHKCLSALAYPSQQSFLKKLFSVACCQNGDHPQEDVDKMAISCWKI
jgi:hypothetical protein